MSERRRFNSRERTALYLAADGRCQSCGAELKPGWHGDHETPYSRGGKTDVTNGQALCPICNVKKGSKLMQLRQWQADALDLFLRSNKDFLAVATPGAGKTTFALTAAEKMMTRDEVRRIIVVVPTSHLRGQWARAAAKAGIQLNHRFANGDGALATDYDGAVVTYHGVAAAPLLWRKLASDVSTLVILDEVHHGGDDLAWGTALKDAFEPATRRLLLSGTPFRTDGAAIPFVTYNENRKCVPSYNYDYGMALLDREVVRPVEFPVLDGSVRWRDAGAVVSTELANADDATLVNALNAALNPDGDWIASVLRRADEELTRQRAEVPDAAGLVVASDQFKARRYAEILRRITGEPATVAISDEPEASAFIDRFGRGTSRWIVAVQMVAEGVDIPRLAVGVYASKIRTEMFFRQVVGRFVRLRSRDDETYATVFIPAIPPLLRFAQDIERTVNQALAEDEQKSRREAKERDGQTQMRFDLVEPLDSSEAVHQSTILSGDTIPDEELRRAEAAMKAVGILTGVSAAQVAKLLRVAGAGRVVGSATVVSEAAPVPLADEKATLRRLLNRKVGKLNRAKELPHSHIHAQLNRITGDNVKTATVETLHRRLEILDRWLEEA